MIWMEADGGFQRCPVIVGGTMVPVWFKVSLSVSKHVGVLVGLKGYYMQLILILTIANTTRTPHSAFSPLYYLLIFPFTTTIRNPNHLFIFTSSMSFRTPAFRSSNSSVDSGAVYTPDIMENGTTSRSSSLGIDSSRAALEERLHEIMVFELREDGTSEYCTMSLRALYNYVVKCIAQSCKEGKLERSMAEVKKRTSVVRFDLNDENTQPSSSQIVNETPNDTSMQNPPHLPSLTSSSPSGATPQTSNHKNANNTRHRRQSSNSIPLQNRLGGYLHPRDMRRLVTPFSASNEPQLMVRRHVMLLNFDPLRAVVLRDRVLVLVPDGADSILIHLEKRVRGGIAEIENDVFGSMVSGKSSEHLSRNAKQRLPSQVVGGSEHMSEEDEWEEIPDIDWSDVPYELLSVDAVLQTVTSMLDDEARRVTLRAVESVRELRGESGGQKITGMPGEHAQERLRWLKDEINGMVGRIQGFIRALNEMLDEDEDMALMNLSRLITHPERFIQPVSAEILQEESDEPELVLEVYLQQALSIVNELELLKAQIMTTQEQISMTLDAMRNRLLYINTLLSLATLVVAIGSFIGSIFGMNLHNPFEDDTDTNIWFLRVTIWTSVSVITLFFVLAFFFYKQTSSTTDWRKKMM